MSSNPLTAILIALLTSFLLVHDSDARTPEQACRSVRRCLKRLDADKRCKVLPVPDSALFLPPPTPFGLKEIRRGIWEYNDGFFRTLIARRGSRLVMVDVPESTASKKEDGSRTKLTDAAEMVLNGTVPKKIEVVYSHEHYDHIGATQLFVDYMKIKYPRVKFDFWGTMSTIRLIENSAVKKAPFPTKIIREDGAQIMLGKRLTLDVSIVGGHVQEDLRVYIPPDKNAPGIVVYYDVVIPNYAPTVNIGITEDLGQTIRAQHEILKLDFKYFFTGHFFMGTKHDMRKNLAYTEDLVKAAKEAEDTVGDKDLMNAGLAKFRDKNAREFGNVHFLILRVNRGAQVQKCKKIMLERWGCRLYGLDIVAEGHCLSALIYLATEF